MTTPKTFNCIVRNPTFESFVPGELYCVDTVWSFLVRDSNYSGIERAYHLAGFTPIMYLGVEKYGIDDKDLTFLYKDLILRMPLTSFIGEVMAKRYILYTVVVV